MARLLGIPSGKRALIVGCGSGVALSPLARLCVPVSVTGIDIDRDMLIEAAQRLDGLGVPANLVTADVRAMPFPDRSFDVVVDFGTCYHISDPGRALCEVSRVLASGGLFAHETPAAQVLAHPRGSIEQLPWEAEPSLAPGPTAVLWAVRTKV